MSNIPSIPSSSSKKLSQGPSKTIDIEALGYPEDPEELSCLKEQSIDDMLAELIKEQETTQRKFDAFRARREQADKERKEHRQRMEKMYRRVEANMAEAKSAERVIGAALNIGQHNSVTIEILRQCPV